VGFEDGPRLWNRRWDSIPSNRALSVRRGEVNQNVDGGWVGGARERSSLRKVTDRCDTSLVSERRAAHPWVSIRWCTVRRARQAIDTRS
jgi:hypothetical protein